MNNLVTKCVSMHFFFSKQIKTRILYAKCIVPMIYLLVFAMIKWVVPSLIYQWLVKYQYPFFLLCCVFCQYHQLYLPVLCLLWVPPTICSCVVSSVSTTIYIFLCCVFCQYHQLYVPVSAGGEQHGAGRQREEDAHGEAAGRSQSPGRGSHWLQ